MLRALLLGGGRVAGAGQLEVPAAVAWVSRVLQHQNSRAITGSVAATEALSSSTPGNLGAAGPSTSSSGDRQAPWHWQSAVSRSMGRAYSSAAAAPPAVSSSGAPQSTDAAAALSQQQQVQLQRPPTVSEISTDLEQLLKVLITPLPVGRAGNASINDVVVNVNRSNFINPMHTLQSVMRALHVITSVLRDNGHVYIVNSNKAMQPLVQEAARCCTNSNVWFLAEEWLPGTLSDHRGEDRLFKPQHQPNQKVFARAGRLWTNVHCPQPDPVESPRPSLDLHDKWRLLHKAKSRRASGKEYSALLRKVVRSEVGGAQLPMPNSLTAQYAKLQLLVVLDLTQGMEAVQEAYDHNVMTMSLVNAHSDLSRVTYPVYGGEFHPAFQHFFLDWIVKTVNTPAPKGSLEEEEGEQQA